MADGTMVFSVPQEDLDATGRVILEAGRWCKIFYADGPWRPRGKWINHRKDHGHNIADCDQCGGTLQWLDPDERPNFCPDCGADMREEGDE